MDYVTKGHMYAVVGSHVRRSRAKLRARVDEVESELLSQLDNLTEVVDRNQEQNEALLTSVQGEVFRRHVAIGGIDHEDLEDRLREVVAETDERFDSQIRRVDSLQSAVTTLTSLIAKSDVRTAKVIEDRSGSTDKRIAAMELVIRELKLKLDQLHNAERKGERELKSEGEGEGEGEGEREQVASSGSKSPLSFGDDIEDSVSMRTALPFVSAATAAAAFPQLVTAESQIDYEPTKSETASIIGTLNALGVTKRVSDVVEDPSVQLGAVRQLLSAIQASLIHGLAPYRDWVPLVAPLLPLGVSTMLDTLAAAYPRPSWGLFVRAFLGHIEYEARVNKAQAEFEQFQVSNTDTVRTLFARLSPSVPYVRSAASIVVSRLQSNLVANETVMAALETVPELNRASEDENWVLLVSHLVPVAGEVVLDEPVIVSPQSSDAEH